MNADALPVAVDLGDPDLATEVTAHVESVLGWQVVRPGPHLPARLALADTVHRDLPTVVVAWAPTAVDVREGLQAGALDVLAWPADAERLADLRVARRTSRPADRVVVVTAAARGVGLTTTTLALGGAVAWTGAETAVVTDPSGLAMAGLADGGPVRGMPHLVVHDSTAALVGDRPAVLVVEAPVGRRGHVLVGRPDRALAMAVARHRGPVLTVGTGGLRTDELRRLVGGRPHVALPWSFRVARAALRGRVPVALPGAWVRPLTGVLPHAGSEV